MSVRPPQSLMRPFSVESGFNVLEYELAAERANALGRHGRTVETALADLKTADAKGQKDDLHQQALLQKASDAVWSFMVQREICGLRNSRDVIQRYEIPEEVLARLGSSPR
ncbi:hypothetical protein ASE04_07075 [Rhizobium sp. Root708]|uniref:DUF6665 family protein n=1 Tax=Rhizobium sp. Root708 TaxID=1736592 RepID=UPI00070207E1|nr:DUF6665 family protein [Rhizobium sp. Root708]KRB52980.1 hypothetical protein ASE04_07075 [Rhizobium sp. Root708]